MGSLFQIVLYTDSQPAASRASGAAFRRIAALDAILSDYRPQSELMRLCKNAGGPAVPVSIDLFRVLREANLALLKSLAPEQWKHHGMHAERGKETIEHIVRMFAGHDINHTKQIEGILAAKKS